MFAAESVRHATGDDHAFDSVGLFSLVQKESSDIFGAFLNEFTGDTWSLQDTEELSSMSTFTNGDDLCEKSESTLHAAQAPGAMLRAAASINGREAASVEALQLCCEEQVEGFEEFDMPCTQQQLSLDDSEKKAPKASPPLKAPPIAATARRRCASVLGASLVDAAVSYSAVRALTNTTYLRRMHLSRDDAIGLFPEVQRILQSVFSKKMKRRVSTRLFKVGIPVWVQDAAGRRWPITIECLRTAGQRHVRFNSGWAEMCAANGLTVGNSIRLDRWQDEAFLSSSSSPSLASSSTSSSASLSSSSSTSEETPVVVTISLL